MFKSHCPMLAAALFLAPALAHADGTFADSAGAKHRWRVQSNHVLLWDDKPFIPIGGLFQVKSWRRGATESDLAEDIDALKKISAAGVLDIYFQPGSEGITRANPAFVQKLIDAAEAEGMTYGLSLSDGPRTALLAYQVLPSRYQKSIGAEGGLARFPVTNAASAYFAVTLLDQGGFSGGTLSAEGEADLVEEGARINVAPAPVAQLVVVYPERIFTPDVTPLPNIWEGLDEYRDRLLTFFNKVKLGKGFRFFTDPLPQSLDLGGESRQLVPTSRDFTTEWAAWLERRYRNTDALVRAWKIQEGAVPTFADASLLVPLFFNEKGFHALYDRRGGRRFPVALDATFWKDLDDFKVDGYRAAINDLSLALKRGIADVPVVCRSRGYQKLLAYAIDARRPDLRRFDFDGIGIDAYGRGEGAARYGGADVYTQVADSPRPLWMPVLATQESRVPESTAPGFSTRASLYALLDSLRGIGARGFYLDGVRVIDPARKPYDLSAIPAQLAWLPEYARQLESTGIAAAASPTQTAIFYPRQLPGFAPTPLSDGAWLLPTDSRGPEQFKVYYFGRAGRCYAMDDGRGTVFYLFNPSGPRQITLRVPKTLTKQAPPYWLPAERGVRKKETITLTIGPEPLRLHGYGPGLPIPEEAFTELDTEAKSLLGLASERKLADMVIFDADYRRLHANFRSDNPDLALGTLQQLQQLCEKMRAQLQNYAWIEAEGIYTDDGASVAPAQYTFDEVETRPGASGGRVLIVRERPPSGQSAAATYEVRTAQDGIYRLWIAASPGANFALRLDSLPWGDESRVPRPMGKTYGSPALIWHDCGPMLLSKGAHKLELRASGPMALDALLLTPGDFTPSGANRPPVLPSDGVSGSATGGKKK